MKEFMNLLFGKGWDMDTGAGAIYAAGCFWEHTGAAGRGAAKAAARAEGAVRNRYDPDLPRSR